jgi:hypothetical protein
MQTGTFAEMANIAFRFSFADQEKQTFVFRFLFSEKKEVCPFRFPFAANKRKLPFPFVSFSVFIYIY